MKKKTVLITGCSSGIGEATARLFIEKGWRVIATARAKEDLIQLDVTKAEDRRAIRDYIEKECEGHLNCLVNNAGYGLMGSIESLSEEQIRDCMETNVLGALFLTRELAGVLKQAKGKVISISSLFGVVGYPLGTAYCMSKFALNGAMESLRHELGWEGIQVGIIIPGAHKTKFGENMKLGQCTQGFFKFRQELRESKRTVGPEIVAETIYRLAEKRTIPFKTYVSFNEKLLRMMSKLLPDRLYDWMLRKISARLQDK